MDREGEKDGSGRGGGGTEKGVFTEGRCTQRRRHRGRTVDGNLRHSEALAKKIA